VHETTCRGRRAWAREVAKNMRVRRTTEHPPAKNNKKNTSCSRAACRASPHRVHARARRTQRHYVEQQRLRASREGGVIGGRGCGRRPSKPRARSPRHARRVLALTRNSAPALRRGSADAPPRRNTSMPHAPSTPAAAPTACGASRRSGRGAREKEEVVNERRGCARAAEPTATHQINEHTFSASSLLNGGADVVSVQSRHA
jgi:hypothetical protein